jgi:hypothetical protein
LDGFLSRVIALVLVFLMLIVSPLLEKYGIGEMENRMEILNDTNEFLDKVTDKGGITDNDLNDFYLSVESHGMTLDVRVDRMVKTSTLYKDADGDEQVSTAYIAADSIDVVNPGDIVKVQLQEVSTTPYKKMLNMFLKIDDQLYSLDMSKMAK